MKSETTVDEAIREATPRPWGWFPTGSEGCSIVANNGRYPRVARLTNADLPTCQADAALIVEAVNAYDRLRAVAAAARTLRVETFGRAQNDEDIKAAWDTLREALDEAPA